MKTILGLAVLLLLSPAVWSSIVNNSTSTPTAEDSLTVQFYSLDSLGNPTTADSVFVLVTAPNGGEAFRDSMSIADNRISSRTVGAKQFYSWAEQVSNIDGSGAPGVYNLALTAKKSSLGLLTPMGLEFQIISTEFSDQIALLVDSVLVKGGIIDSNKTERGDLADSTSVARWVWNTPQASHTTNGTFGKYLDTEVSGIGGGGGAYAFTLVTYDTAASQAVAGASLQVRGINQSSLIAIGATNGIGEVGLNLDADSFIVVTSSPGYVFEAYDTLVVVGAGVDTIFGYQFNVGTPSDPAKCRVYDWVYNLAGQPEVGISVTAFLPGGVASVNGIVISPFAIATTTDTAGLFTLDLYPSESFNPSDTRYEITIMRSDGTVLRQRVTVPDSTNWKLTW